MNSDSLMSYLISENITLDQMALDLDIPVQQLEDKIEGLLDFTTGEINDIVAILNLNEAETSALFY